MKMKFAIVFVMCGFVFAQVQQPTRIRVSGGVMVALADHKVLPDVSDLKGYKLNSIVTVAIHISKDGGVSFARSQEGDTDLYKRSEHAVLNWHFKPYILNGVPVEVDTTISFRYHKNKVSLASE